MSEYPIPPHPPLTDPEMMRSAEISRGGGLLPEALFALGMALLLLALVLRGWL